MTKINNNPQKAKREANKSKQAEQAELEQQQNQTTSQSQKFDSLDFQEQIDATEDFLDRNKRNFLIVIGVLVVSALSFIFWQSNSSSKSQEALDQMFVAEQYFAQDSVQKALDGDGNYPGFIQIIEDYSGTPSGNLAYFYSGVCYMKLGEFEKAISYLEKYSAEDEITGITAKGAIGDAYSQLKQYDKAITYYQQATNIKLSAFTPVYLMKLGLVYEELNQNDKALAAYKEIKKDYEKSSPARNIDAFIGRAEEKITK